MRINYLLLSILSSCIDIRKDRNVRPDVSGVFGTCPSELAH